MATVYPTSAGNWSTRTWFDDSTGAAYSLGTPQPGDTVLCNNVAITIDVSIHVDTLNNVAGSHAAAGGTFTVSANGLTSTVDTLITCGTVGSYVFSATSPNSHTITGSALTIAGSSTTAVNTVNISSTGTLNITATVTGGGSGSSNGAISAGSGTLNLTGNVTGATAPPGITIGSGSVTINGTCTGGSGVGAYGVRTLGAGTVTATTAVGGSVAGTHGISNGSTGIVNITTAIGGSVAGAYGVNNAAAGTTNVATAVGGSATSTYGAFNNATGNLNVTSATASTTSPAVGDNASTAGLVTVAGTLTNSGNIQACVATHMQVAQTTQWTIAKASGTVTLKAASGASGIKTGGQL